MQGAIGRGRNTILLFAALALAGPAVAQGPTAGERWQFSVEPYLWAAGAGGSLKFELPEGDGDGGVSIDDVSLVFMLRGDARKGDWAVFSDVAYVELDWATGDPASGRAVGPSGRGAFAAALDSGSTVSLSGLKWEVAGGYTVARRGASSLDVFAGVRYLTIDTTLDWRLGPVGGSLSPQLDRLDGIVGVRGALGLGESGWYLPYYLDLGGDGSAFTWETTVGVGYRFGWGDVHLGYRYLSYDARGDSLLQSLELSGPGLGVMFRF